MQKEKIGGLGYCLTHNLATGMPLSVRQLGVRVVLLLVVAVAVLTAVVSFLPSDQLLRAEDIKDNEIRIAIVEDDIFAGQMFLDYVDLTPTTRSNTVDWYKTCEELLANMETGVRYHAYILDTVTKIHGSQNGFDCARAVRELDPGAYIIGNSSDPTSKSDWDKLGFVKEFSDKLDVTKILLRILGGGS